jgi:hypothetical protein
MATVPEVTQTARRLNSEQLDDVIAFMADLLATEDTEELEEQAADGNSSKSKGSPAGWVELKHINGYGPYAYLRWRDGKRMRSKYLGKARDLGSNAGRVNGKTAP